MRILMVIAIIMALAACANVSEMRANEPFSTFVSAKSPDDIAACTSEAWTTQQVMPIFLTPDVRINPIANGKQVMIYNSHSMAPDAFVDLVEDGAGTKVVYYAKHRKRFKQGYADLLQSCL